MSEKPQKTELILSQMIKPSNETTEPSGDELGLSSIMHIASGRFPGHNYINVKYNIIVQGEWKLTKGNVGGITHCACGSSNTDELFFNYTASFELATTSLCRFPCLLFIVYGMDFFGRSVILGYGQTPIPPVKGLMSKEVMIFRPKSHTWLSNVIGRLKGTPTEFINPKETVINNEGRAFVRSETVGSLFIEFDTKRIKWLENGFQ